MLMVRNDSGTTNPLARRGQKPECQMTETNNTNPVPNRIRAPRHSQDPLTDQSGDQPAAPVAPTVVQVQSAPQPAPQPSAPKGPAFLAEQVVQSADLNLMTPRAQRVAVLKKDPAAAALDREAGDRLHGQIQRSKPLVVRFTDWMFGNTVGRIVLVTLGAAVTTAAGMVFYDAIEERRANQGL